MDLLDRFRSFFIDDFKTGVESQSKKSVLYFNGNRYDQQQIQTVLGSATDAIRNIKKHNPSIDLSDPKQIENIPEHLKKPLLNEVDKLAKLVGDQFDESIQGLSASASKMKLAAIMATGLTKGPFAERKIFDTNMCLVNQPLGNELDPENLLKDGLIGFAQKQDFNADHFKPLPGNKAVWDRLVGAHEGEHCNQDDIEMEHAEGDDLLKKTIEGETRSDRAAIKDLIQNGHADVAQAWKDIRIIATVGGDDTHATTLFLDDENFELTDAQLDEIKNIRDTMNSSVGEALGTNKYNAESLRKQDPQRYAQLLQEQIDSGKFPPKKELNEEEQKSKISKLTGLSVEDVEKADPSNFPAITDAYKKLKADGEFTTRGSSPETSTRLAQQYIGATQRLMVADTAPKVDPAAQADKAEPKKLELPEEDLTDDGSVISDDELEAEANDQSEILMNRMVAKQLGIEIEDASDLSETDPEKYLQAAKEALKAGKVDQTTDHYLTAAQKERRQERILGIEPGSIKDMPNYMQNAAEEALKTDPKTKLKDDGSIPVTNPHTTRAVVTAIQEFEQKLRNPAPAVDAEVPEASKDAPPTEPPKEEKMSSLFQQNAADMTSSLIAKVSAPDAQIEAPLVRQRQPAAESLAV